MYIEFNVDSYNLHKCYGYAKRPKMGGDWYRHELNDLLEKARQGHAEDDRIAEQIFAYLIERHRSSGCGSGEGNPVPAKAHPVCAT